MKKEYNLKKAWNEDTNFNNQNSQNEKNELYNEAGETGSEIENEANAKAGVLLRNYGKMNDLIYENKKSYNAQRI
jgi:hypothetical protein